MTKVIEYEPGTTITLQIWDIGGQDRYKVLRSSFFDGANGALIVFDLSRWHTFEELEDWLKDLREYAGENVPFVLIGNKADLIEKSDELYERESAQVFAKKEKTYYVETSAKTGEKVEDAFLNLTKRMLKNIVSNLYFNEIGTKKMGKIAIKIAIIRIGASSENVVKYRGGISIKTITTKGSIITFRIR